MIFRKDASIVRGASAPNSAPVPDLMMEPPTLNTMRQTSCYTTPTQATVMRTCSQQPCVESMTDDE